VSHELVRHRIASFSQESTRFCNYGKGEVTFIIPEWFNADDEKTVMDTNDAGIKAWRMTMEVCEGTYRTLLALGWKPQEARSVLPNSLKTEIIVTANIREWRLILKQRTGKKAHPQMRELMCPLLDELKNVLTPLFEDISYER
jgi:thymidylate synthase (FAD)